MTAPTKAPPTDTGRCGETAGYRRHQRAGEEPCEPCRYAKRATDQQRRDERSTRRLADLLVGAKPLPEWTPFGRFAGRDVPHTFRPMGTQCLACWGWPDDVRHL